MTILSTIAKSPDRMPLLTASWLHINSQRRFRAPFHAAIARKEIARYDTTLIQIGVSAGITLEIQSVMMLRPLRRKRGKSGGGMIIRFARRRASDSVGECRRRTILTAFRLPS